MTSISDMGGCYAQNAHTLKAWETMVNAGTIPVAKGIAVTDDDVLRRFVINRVMCLLKLDLREVGQKFGAGAREAIEVDLRSGVQELQDDGLVTFDGDLLRVTALGQLLVRNVAMLFDAYLKREGGQKQFSRTV
jgi:oxygen-independent coproporphyrinogen-3 oxidase